jgi:crossover junction endodeoxyribonuclease RuvC
MVTIIGIDPGLAATGIGTITGEGTRVHRYAYSTIRTVAADSLSTRLEHIYSRVSDALRDARPGLMVVEDVFSLNKYPRSGITLGKVTGVILLAGSQAGVPVREVAVREAKQVLTGNGRASKQQLELSIRNYLKLKQPIRPYHASDAVGLALIGLLRYAGAAVSGR